MTSEPIAGTETAGSVLASEPVAASDAAAPDGENPVAAAAERVRERRGRPRGSRDKTKRKRRSDAGQRSPRGTATALPADDVPPPPQPFELAICKRLGEVVFRLIGSRTGHRALTSDESDELAGAAVPVFRKYGGAVVQPYAEELALGMVLYELWLRTAPEPELDPALATSEPVAVVRDESGQLVPDANAERPFGDGAAFRRTA